MHSIVAHVKRIPLFVFVLMVMVGCSIMVKPSTIPMVKGVDNVSLKGSTLAVMNAEKDASPYEIANEKGQKLGIIANRQVWSGKLVESLSGELARRGAQIRAKASFQISIAVPDITFSMPNNSYQFTVKVAVASSKGWTKTYEGTAESGTGLLESTTSLTDRLSGQALSAAVKTILSDGEFIKQLNQK